jgi:hypothetical protein
MYTPVGFFASQVPAPVVVTANLEQWIDPAISDTLDQSVNGRNVTLEGSLTTSGGNYILNGGTKCVANGWSQTLTTTWTWCTWFRLYANGMGAQFTNIIGNYISTTTPFAQVVIPGTGNADTGKVLINSMRTTTNNPNTALSLSTIDERGSGWHYYCWAYNAVTGQYSAWQDGQLILSGTLPSEVGNYTSGQNLKTYGGHFGRHFSNAEGGPFQIYSSFLSNAEVLQNFDADRGRYGL